MSLVPDASVVVAALIDRTPTGAWAESIIGGGSLIAPELPPELPDPVLGTTPIITA